MSVAVRFNTLNSPFDRREEWQTGHVLSTLKIWEQNGITSHYFSPVCTFNNPGDKITNSLGGIKDNEGYTYYVSYPPLSFILPYVAFKLSGQDVSVCGIRIFSLFIHFYCALLILLIVYKLFEKRFQNTIFIPGFIAFCVYVFATGNLWFHSNFYFADSLVHVFVLSLIYQLQFVVSNPSENTTKNSMFVFAFTFLGVYTEWLALLFSGIAFLYLSLKHIREKTFAPYLLAIFLGSALAIMLCLFQYSQIAGMNTLIEFLKVKFSGRSGLVEGSAIDGTSIYQQAAYQTIYTNYISNYGYLIKTALGSACVLAILRITNPKTKPSSQKKIFFGFFGVILLAVLFHHILFFNFTAIHDISTLKATIPICLFIGWVYGMLLELSPKRILKLLQAFAISLVCLFAFYSVQGYRLMNTVDADSYAQKLVGESVKKQAGPEELVFTNVGVSPVLMWHAQRNPILAPSLENCRKKLDSLNYKSAIFFSVSSQNNRFSVETIRLLPNGDTLILN